MRIGFINMPFADFRRPSIAIAQLRSVIDEKFGERVQTDEFSFNLEMAELLGPDIYEFISSSGTSNETGFGDWLFRQEAFPHLADNSKDYFKRYGVHFGEDALRLYRSILEGRRKHLGQVLDEWVFKNKLFEYDVLGFTSMFMQNVPSFALARCVKLRNPSVTILIGGANCESPMGEAIAQNVKHVDYVFSGNALTSLPKFISCMLDGEMEKAEAIDGVFSKRNCISATQTTLEGGLRALGKVGIERPINDLVRINFDDFLDVYEKKFSETGKRPHLLFETSRGCWWGAKAHCTFCGLNGGNMGYRAIAPSSAVQYIQGLIDKYAHRVDHFSCVDNIIPKEYFTDVFPFLNVPDNVSIFYEVKADLTESQVRILADTHVSQIQPGIEALATPTLKLMRKGTTSFGNIRLLKNCLRYMITPFWNLLIGFPGEGRETYENYSHILPNLFHLPPPSGVFPVRFDRYSPYFTMQDEYKLVLRPLDYYNFIYPFAQEIMSEMAYYFSNHNSNLEYIGNVADWIEALKRITTKWTERWHNPSTRPKLLVTEESGVFTIHDSRGDKPLRYEISETEIRILDMLETHRNTMSLIAGLKDIAPAKIEESLLFLREKKLIFEEKESMLNLIAIHDPQANLKELVSKPEEIIA